MLNEKDFMSGLLGMGKWLCVIAFVTPSTFEMPFRAMITNVHGEGKRRGRSVRLGRLLQ
jgi:hypothetical protein